MKLIVLFAVVALVSGDYPAAQPEPPSDSYGAPVSDPVENTDETPSPTSTQIDYTKTFFNFQKGYVGALPPATFPYTNFLSKTTFPTFKYPLKTFNYPTTFSANPQGILPPQITQIIPPVSNIVPPISNIVPPVLGNTQTGLPVLGNTQTGLPVLGNTQTGLPVLGNTQTGLPVLGNTQTALPVNPSQVVPPAVQAQVPAQVFPPQLVTPQTLTRPTQYFTSQFPKFTYNYAFPTFNHYFKTPYTFPSFPTTGLFSAALPTQKEPAKNQEPLSTSYGPPATEAPAQFEPSGPAESSAPFEPAPVSFPYEPAVPDTPEPASAPYKPAQEYGVPN